MVDIIQSTDQKVFVIDSDGRLHLQNLGATITSIQPVEEKPNIIESAFNNSNKDVNLSYENIDINKSNNIILSNTIFQENILNGSLNLTNFHNLSSTFNEAITGNSNILVTSSNNKFIPIKSKITDINLNPPIIIQKPILTTEFNSNNAPLGSQQNPIRIIQQGNNFVPLQNLNPEQLQQIIQAIQDQTKTQEVQQNIPDQTNIVSNPQTQTKIVYRVVYPAKTASSGNIKIRPKSKIKKKTTDQIYNFDWDTSISSKAKEKQKKHRQRTRYGRLSKPPHYMVKDYKHIHPVDYEEDYDDSDGGYSDFTESANERDSSSSPNKKRSRETTNEFLYTGKLRNHKCQICGKGYIGSAGLNRHLKINPSHGNPNYEGDELNTNDNKKDVKKELLEDDQPTATLFTDHPFSDNQMDCSLDCQDMTSRDDEHSGTCEEENSANDMCNENKEANNLSMKKKSRRGRPPQPANSIKRRKKLLEIIRKSSTIEIIDSVFGYLAKDPNFKLIKIFISLVRSLYGINKKASIHPKFIISQLQELFLDVGEFLKSYISLAKKFDEDQESIEITDDHLIKTLGLPECGEYWFRSNNSDNKFQNIESNCNIKEEQFEIDTSNQSNIRSHDKENNLRKKFKKYLYYGNNKDILGEVTAETGQPNVDNYDEEINANNEDCLPNHNLPVTAVESFEHSNKKYVNENRSNEVNNINNACVNYSLNDSQNIIGTCTVLMDDNEQSFDTLFEGMIVPEKVMIDDHSNDDDLKEFLPTSQPNSFTSGTSINSNLFACLISSNSQQSPRYIESKSSSNNIELIIPDNTNILNNVEYNNNPQLISMDLASDMLPNENEDNNCESDIVSNFNVANSVNESFVNQIYDTSQLDLVAEQMGNNMQDNLQRNDLVVVMAEDGSIQIHSDVTQQISLDITNQCLN